MASRTTHTLEKRGAGVYRMLINHSRLTEKWAMKPDTENEWGKFGALSITAVTGIVLSFRSPDPVRGLEHWNDIFFS
jgi:hypothetical protein